MAEATTVLQTSRAAGLGALPGKTLYVLVHWPILPLFFLLGFIVMAIFAPVISPYDPAVQNLRARTAPPIWYGKWYQDNPRVTTRHILGADHVGRDVLSRVIYGARVSLLVAGISLSTGLIVGTTLGLISGYFGRHIDEFIMRLVDVWLSMPFLLIALVATIVFDSSFALVMGLLALLAWSAFVRNVRAEVLSLKQRDYVALARVAGASNLRIIVRHILPGVINTIIVIATLRVGQLILAEAALSFLGAGIPDPTPAWGLMISQGRDYIASGHWWIAFFPGIAIFLVVMSLNFLGDWMRDKFDPRLRQL
jgi:peptide/nickel transport system permease protein